MKFIAIGGEPASGKTTLMRALIHKLGGSKALSSGKLKGHYFSQHKLFILGVYGSGETFEGTDKLSMAVQPDAINFLNKLKDNPRYPGHRVIFEGDRLFTASFLEEAQKMSTEFKIFVLDVKEETKDTRHIQRGDSQSEQFLKGRKTKIENIMKKFEVQTLINETEQDLTMNMGTIMEYLGAVDED